MPSTPLTSRRASVDRWRRGLARRQTLRMLVIAVALGGSVYMVTQTGGQHADRRQQTMRYGCEACGHAFSVTVNEINAMMRSGRASTAGLDCPQCQARSSARPIFACKVCGEDFFAPQVEDNRCPHCGHDLAQTPP